MSLRTRSHYQTKEHYIKELICVTRNTPLMFNNSNGVSTPEQDNDKTTIRQMLNLCISMMPFTPGLSDHRRNAQVQHLSCHCLVVVLIRCENTITVAAEQIIHWGGGHFA